MSDLPEGSTKIHVRVTCNACGDTVLAQLDDRPKINWPCGHSSALTLRTAASG